MADRRVRLDHSGTDFRAVDLGDGSYALAVTEAGGTTVTRDEAVTVGTNSTQIAAANPNRRSILLFNRGSVDVYVTTVATATTNHLPIAPGVAATFEHTQAINGVVGSGTGTLYVVEESA